MKRDGKISKSRNSAGAVNTAKKLPGIPFKAGDEWRGNFKGRPRGARSKLGEEFLSAMHADFAKHGSATIQMVRQERPHDYLKVVASVLPKEMNVTTSQLEEMSDDDLALGIAALQSIIAAQVNAEERRVSADSASSSTGGTPTYRQEPQSTGSPPRACLLGGSSGSWPPKPPRRPA